MAEKQKTKKLSKLFTGKRSFSKRLLLALLPSLALSFTLFFFGPLDLSYVSRDYVNYSALDILPLTALVMAAVFVILLLLASIPGGAVHAFLISVYSGLSIACYVQGAYLNPDFGTLDGHNVNWPSFSKMMMINLAIWFVILLIPHLVHYFSNKVWRGFTMLVCGALILMQCVSLGVKLADQIKIDRSKTADYYLSNENMLRVGSEDNIVVFLLDTTSPRDIQSMLEKYPGTFDAFHDFTLYQNANSHYMYTVPSLVSILTGEDWDCENVSISDYMNSAWNSERAAALYGGMSAQGYERNFYMLLPEAVRDPSNLKNIFSNLKETGTDRSIDRGAMLKLFKLSFYRYFPIMLKPFFVIYTTDISNLVTRQDAMNNEWDFVSRMNEDTLAAGPSKNVFSFYYLSGSHLPFRMDERGRLINSELAPGYLTNYSEKEDQLAGFFELIGSYMRQLDKLGVYDQTGIIILADHGNNVDKDADHQPLYMIKMPGTRQETYQVSDAPVTTQECFIPDVMAMLDVVNGSIGIRSADVPEKSVERWTRVYAKDNDMPVLSGSTYNVMREYRYTGDGAELIRVWGSKDYTTIPMLDSYY